MNKKCQNCAHLQYKKRDGLYGLYGSDTFWCDLHDVNVDHPKDQFCEENWLSITAKQRIDKLEQLRI